MRQSSVPNRIFSPLSSLLSPHVAPTCGARHREIEGRREEKGEALTASSIFSIFLARPSENLNGQDLSLYHKGFRVFLGLSQRPIFLLLKNCRWAPLVADLGAHRPKNEPQNWATRSPSKGWATRWATRWPKRGTTCGHKMAQDVATRWPQDRPQDLQQNKPEAGHRMAIKCAAPGAGKSRRRAPGAQKAQTCRPGASQRNWPNAASSGPSQPSKR